MGLAPKVANLFYFGINSLFVFLVFFIFLFFLQQFSILLDFLILLLLFIGFLRKFGSVDPVDFGVDHEDIA